MPRTLVVLAFLGLVACSTGARRYNTQRAVPYGPTTQSAPPYGRTVAPPRTTVPTTYPASPSRAPAVSPGQRTTPMPAPRPMTSTGPFVWHARLADAQAQARREGKLILVGSTNPGCGLCEKFRNQIVPAAGTTVSSQMVGYMIQTQSMEPGGRQLWSVLKRNLANAGLMPLVGVFSPDLQYLAGFGGPPDNQKLMSALSLARSRTRGAAPVTHTVPAPPYRTAQINEYGEYEWAPTGSLWPEDAVTPDLQPARPPAAVAAAPATPAPAMRPAPEPEPKAVATVPAPASKAAVAAPLAPEASGVPTAVEDSMGPDGTALAALDRALERMKAGDLGAAKTALADVRTSHAGTPLAREAAKGEVAIYNLQQIEAAANGTDRARLRMRALENLRGSMWAALFRAEGA